MERRQIFVTIGTSAFAGGVTAGVASLQPTPYQVPLACLASAGFATGVTTWAVLLFTAPSRTAKPERDFITIIEAGRRLYERSSNGVREAMARGVPGPFDSIDEAGSAYVHEAMKECGIQFYARRGEGLRLEPISKDEANPASLDKILGTARIIQDISIRRKDVGRVIGFYKLN